MRLTIQILISFLLCGLVFRSAHAQDLQFPYDALVAKADTEIRSGPGKLHYSTEKLQPGSTVKVYRIDPGNWAAIQPTVGSFSLVPASAVKLLDAETGEVLAEGTQAWVGTRLSAVEKPLWQVKLRKGEQVDILGEVHWPSPEGHSVLWYQIAPPDGEFRWVKLDDLEEPIVANNETPAPQKLNSKPIDIAKQNRTNSDRQNRVTSEARQNDRLTVADLNAPMSPDPPQVARNWGERLRRDFDTGIEQSSKEKSTIEQVDFESEINSNNREQETRTGSDATSKPVDANVPDNSGWRMARHRIDRKFPEPQITEPGNADAKTNQLNERKPPQNRIASTRPDRVARDFSRPAVDRNPNSSSVLATPSSLPPIGPLPNTPEANQLRMFELNLAQQMGKPPLSWKFEEIKLKVEQIQAQADQPITRQYASRMLQKIKSCEQIRARLRQAHNSDATANTLLGDTPGNMPIGSGVDTTVQLGTTYDAYGWLKELKRDGGRRPPEFVLTDDNGKITYHIAGVAGLNLRRYLESKVGVIGRRGFHQQLNLNHVTVERIIELKKK